MERASSWSAVSVGLEEVLGEPVELGEPLGRSRTKACVRAAASAQHGQLVVKLRHGDRADEKTSWLATHLPRLAERGYPAPRILWHGPISVHWYAVVEERLPGTPVHSLADEQLLALLDLVELQADAAIAPGPRDFGSYVSNVLFDDWDGVWHDANSTRRTAALCADLTNLLRPIRGHPIVGLDFAHNDLNLSNVLSDGRTVTGIVDWDEFGLNNRAADLTALAFDCIKLDQAGAFRWGRPRSRSTEPAALQTRPRSVASSPTASSDTSPRGSGEESARSSTARSTRPGTCSRSSPDAKPRPKRGASSPPD
jgi:hypothetical protein